MGSVSVCIRSNWNMRRAVKEYLIKNEIDFKERRSLLGPKFIFYVNVPSVDWLDETLELVASENDLTITKKSHSGV